MGGIIRFAVADQDVGIACLGHRILGKRSTTKGTRRDAVNNRFDTSNFPSTKTERVLA